jgi:uncharacterized protein YjbI with pentapeptide repeats
MRKTNLVGANLKGARIMGTDLRLANLQGATISLAQMKEIRKLKGATLPNGRFYDPDLPLNAQLN